MAIAHSIIIPAYNEEKKIEYAVREVSHAFARFGATYEIIVVDDGSRDRTGLIVRKLAKSIPYLRLIRHRKNSGKGAAIKTGVRHARGRLLFFLDADLSTHPREFAEFLPYLEEYDVVFGSRRTRGTTITKRQPRFRIWAGKLFNFFVRSALQVPFRDTQCGFKAFHRRVRPLFLRLTSKRWVFDAEFLANAVHRGFSLKELPVTWHHGRESRVRLRDVFNIFRELLRARRTLLR
ncbi:MAG TPA: dolichyl-phosphate beta-glucosyltransferase [Patescibacteria group bacterium]|nr:dolichyl-phosphate beta-glucosyltransferase [Patescibacteria group bacterium]